jgi:RNA methyltransferase, TrmH family
MLSAGQIKHIRSLALPKFRKMHNRFIVEGEKMVAEALNSDYLVEHIYALEGWARKSAANPELPVSKVTIVSNAGLNRISNLKTPNNVLAIVNIPELAVDKTIFDDLVLALDRIADPGNLGTIIRLADWFGIRNLLCSHDTVELYNPKVVQATMGSLFRVKVHYVDLVEIIGTMAGNLPKYAALLDGENIFNQDLPKNAVVIIGNESQGISGRVANLADYRLTIPSVTKGAESLNVSMATAIICSEFRKHLFLNK